MQVSVFVFCNFFCLLYDSIICGQFIFLLGQPVSKASLAALRLSGYFCDIVVMMLLSENKYDDDDDHLQT